MQVTHLQIDGQSFFLERDEDVEALEAQILHAVASGPRFLKFRAAGHGLVSVLITPHIGIRFESREIDEAEVAGWESAPPNIDFPYDY